MSGELLWHLSRAAGLATLVLLTLVVVLGTVTAGRRLRGAGATVVMAVHRSLALGMCVFLAGHIVTAIVDGYVDLGWISAVVPFTSGYETFWVGLGTLAVDVLVAVVVTSLARHRLPERAWRAVHRCAYGLWPLALVHGFAMGTADEPMLRGATLACGAVGVGAVLVRLLLTDPDGDRRRLVAAGEWS